MKNQKSFGDVSFRSSGCVLRFALAVAAMCLASVPLRGLAATYYVDDTPGPPPVGSPGTIGNPYSSLGALYNVHKTVPFISAGDTIDIAAGVYRETVRIQHLDGTPGNPITIQGAGIDQTFIRGTAQVETGPGSGWVDEGLNVFSMAWQASIAAKLPAGATRLFSETLPPTCVLFTREGEGRVTSLLPIGPTIPSQLLESVPVIFPCSALVVSN